MAPVLSTADEHLAAAAKSVAQIDRAAAASSLAAAGKSIKSLREQVAKQPGDDAKAAEWELACVSAKIDRALVDDLAIPIDTQADRHELVAGENFTVDVTIGGAPVVPAKWTLDASSFLVPTGWTITPAESKATSDDAKFQVAIPAGAKPPSSPGDRILPFPPPLIQLNLPVTVDGYSFRIERTINSVQASTTGILTYPSSWFRW